MSKKQPYSADLVKTAGWRSGRPPSPGWYVASDSKDAYAWRWFDGKGWSRPARPHHSATWAGKKAKQAAVPNNLRKRPIRWSPFYPSNARVPR